MKAKIFFYLAAILLLAFSVSAFDCSKTQDPNYCNEIQSSGFSEPEKELVYSALLYPESGFPDHNFIENYNLQINIDNPPDNTPKYDSTQIKNAWISFLAVFPSVYNDEELYLPISTNALSQYDYDVQIPSDYSGSYPHTSNGDCKRKYNLVQNDAKLSYYLNNAYKGQGKYSALNIDSDGTLKAELQIDTKLKVEHYRWETYCCSYGRDGCNSYCHRCKYDHTDYETDSLKISEEKQVKLDSINPTAIVYITDNYLNLTKGKIIADDYSQIDLEFQDSYVIKHNYYYDVVFDKKPYYFAYLNAHYFPIIKQKNIFLANDTFFVKNSAGCSISTYNHFYSTSSTCDLTLHQENLTGLTMPENDSSIGLLVLVVTLLFIIYVIYKIARSQFKKLVLPILILMVLMPFALAAEQQQESCGLTNLAECIPEKIYEYILVIINSPLLPMLVAVQSLLTAQVTIDIFFHIWDVIRYILSFFYVFLFVYAGFVFLTSNANPIKRAHAKETIKDTVIMIVLIQASFYLYGFILSISSILNNAILSMVDPHFFLLTVDNITNIGLELLTSSVYGLTLFVTMLMLVMRYIVVSIGVVLFPIGLFCYFVPPLKGYGKFILNMLGIFIFITFIDLLIILACSMIVDIPIFENFKILVMISCFLIVNYTLWLAIKFALKKSSAVSIKDDINQAVKYIALLA